MSVKLDASTLISSLPALLGYQVYDSIVAVLLKRHDDGDVIDCVLRTDLHNSVEQIATMPRVTGRSAANHRPGPTHRASSWAPRRVQSPSMSKNPSMPRTRPPRTLRVNPCSISS